MTDDQYVVDDSDLRKYRIELPNMADDELDPYQMRLYVHYKRVGMCWESIRTTADKTRMSVGKVDEVRNWLTERGWIEVYGEDIDTKFPDGLIILIVDRWPENFAKYAKRSPHEQGVHPMNGKRSPHELKKLTTSFKKKPKKRGDALPPEQRYAGWQD